MEAVVHVEVRRLDSTEPPSESRTRGGRRYQSRGPHLGTEERNLLLRLVFTLLPIGRDQTASINDAGEIATSSHKGFGRCQGLFASQTIKFGTELSRARNRGGITGKDGDRAGGELCEHDVDKIGRPKTKLGDC